MIRVISGTYRHRAINQPDSKMVRPTMDKVREAIFSALGTIVDEEVLDVFAGSGAFGIESLSRGAKHCTFIDSLKLSILSIKKTLDSFAIDPSKYSLLLQDYKEALRSLRGHGFSLIFLDPPYEMDITHSSLKILIELDMINLQGRVVVETPLPPKEVEGFTLKTYHYGIRYVAIYRREK